jgi:hypothetical protein
MILEGNKMILEGNKIYSISFIHNGENKKFSSSIFRKVYTDVIYFLYLKGYKFDESVKGRELINKSEVPKNYIGHGIYYIPNSKHAILVNFGIEQSSRYIQIMLERFGAKNINITIDNSKISSNRIKKIDPDDPEFRTERPKSFNYPEDDDNYVMDFKHFRGIQAQPESKLEEPVKTPFGGTENSSAICVLGESGAGKSTTIDKILRKENHVFEFIIPTAATTGLLSQFSPSKGSSGGYILSRLGRMLIDASGNPNKFYTAVFDECHKAQTIDMINDELLQAISKKRNRGNRFISLDDDTAELYRGKLKPDDRRNLLIPDNFGFIFISSKPDIIAKNDDFFNRVDLIELTEGDWEINNIEGLLSKKVEELSDKREFLDKLKSKYLKTRT